MSATGNQFAARATGAGIVLTAATFFSPAVVAGLGVAAVGGVVYCIYDRLTVLERAARLHARQPAPKP